MRSSKKRIVVGMLICAGLMPVCLSAITGSRPENPTDSSEAKPKSQTQKRLNALELLRKHRSKTPEVADAVRKERVMGEGEIRNKINGEFDDEGYFEIYLSQEQYQQFQSGKAWFEVVFPYTDRKAYRGLDIFANDLLAVDKAKAGVARIPRPKREPDSLVGKHLPELKAFNIDLSQTSTQSEVVLVCFFDMNQRPSRRCIGQLTKQANQLKQKGVTVVAVQASKVDENTLNKWVKDYNIPFQVGMIEGGEEQTRFNWAVKSLPWLILADRNHQVIAEGFGLNELEDRLEETNHVGQ